MGFSSRLSSFESLVLRSTLQVHKQRRHARRV